VELLQKKKADEQIAKELRFAATIEVKVSAEQDKLNQLVQDKVDGK
jgi:hypothetical protein